MKKHPLRNLFLAGSSILAISSVHAGSGTWNVDADGNWSLDTNWTSNPTVPGTTAGDLIGLTNNIGGNRTVTIDTTARTVGTLNIGDSDDTHSFTLAASGGGFLTFNNGGGGASIVEAGAKADTISSNVTLADNLSASVAGTLTISGDIGGAFSFTKTGTGSLKLSGNNDFSGGFTLSEGTLDTRNSTGAAIGTGTFTVDDGAIIFLTGGGTSVAWTTTNDNVWTGGTIMLNRNSGGQPLWQNDGDITLENDVTVATTAGNISAGAIFNGDINDGGNGYSLSLGVGGGAVNFTLAGNNTHSGGTTIGASRANTLNINSSSALGTGNFTIASGNVQTLDNTSGSAVTLNTNNTQSWDNNFIFTGTNDLNLGSGAVTINNNRTVTVTAGTLTVGGAIGQSGGSRALTKSGDGTLVLGGNSSYTGATTVTAGSLIVNGNISTSSLTTVNSGGTIGGSGTLGALTIDAGGKLDLTGATLGSSSMGVLSIASGSLTLGDLTFEDLVGWDWMNASEGTYELIDGTFSIDFGFTAFTSLETAYDFGNGNVGYFTSGSLNAVIVAIPEPKAAILGIIGMLMLLRRRRR